MTNQISPTDLKNSGQRVVYMNDGSTYMPVPVAKTNFVPSLKPGVYNVKASMQGLFFEEAGDFTHPGKLYGDVTKRAERILNTFNDRPGGTGVLLTGEKGSGKTMLAKLISYKAGVELGIPTIIVNTDMTGDAFCGIINDLPSAVVIFDEFEKVYDEKAQAEILTLLEGVYSSKKLFLFTCNNKNRLNEHMINRPGRIFYYYEYNGLEKDFIVEYCKDNLKDVSKTDSVVLAATIVGKFNFDMLKSLVEEMNRYDETAQQSMSVLNIRPSSSLMNPYEATFNFGGFTLASGDVGLDIDKWDNPLNCREIEVILNMPCRNTVNSINENPNLSQEDKDVFLKNLNEVLQKVVNEVGSVRMISPNNRDVGSSEFDVIEKIINGYEKTPEEKPVPVSGLRAALSSNSQVHTGYVSFEITPDNFQGLDVTTGSITYTAFNGFATVTFTPKKAESSTTYRYLA